ncbi:MAG TPA: class I SAM-dependent methyltransferase [Streptosporangiaceae bacterium]|nr:class I SAM-dependent methyltransferase [Streptosporangiaceae bacterium]
MSFYADHVLPRLIDRIMRAHDLDELRTRVASKLTGDVLEIGFGSGLNVPFYPSGVTRVWALDPATVGRKLAAARVAASPVPVEYIGLDAQRIPLPDGSVDSVLTTWTLCTIPDVGQALSEVRRVLRPGGTLSFVEHGRSPDPAVARSQRRVEPVQSLVFGGCKLTRPIDQLITASGLDLTGLKQYYRPGLRASSYTYEGHARRTDRT